MRHPALPVATLVVCCWSALAADPPKPPPAVVPALEQSNPPILCIDCDAPFDTATHKQLLKDLANSPYIAEMRKGLYFQDILHQFESKAHFDNCDFDSAIAYMIGLLDETQSHVAAAQDAKTSNDPGAMQAAAKLAFLALGQAVHGVQDFYAHSNYVEMQVPKVKDVLDIEIITPWRSTGRERIKQLRTDGLVSGFVFWGFPQKCPANTLSHADLAKDSDSTKSGKRLVPRLQNISQYRIAVFLAREASLKFMNDAFKRWPLLKEINGPQVPVDVLIDRRGL
jgi:hypothetical protein